MTQYLPPNLLALFAPRDPCPFLPPPDKLPHEKKNRGYNGVGDFLLHFEDPGDTPPPLRVETREERMERRRRERSEQVAYKLEQEIAMWDPHNLPTATTDPFKTLFIARINYDTSESKLRREFEVYGPIKKIVLSHNVNDGKPRGYAFIEYEHERDMHTAYKHADGKKIDGRRVLVDVERGRTVKGWLPRRLVVLHVSERSATVPDRGIVVPTGVQGVGREGEQELELEQEGRLKGKRTKNRVVSLDEIGTEIVREGEVVPRIGIARKTGGIEIGGTVARRDEIVTIVEEMTKNLVSKKNPWTIILNTWSHPNISNQLISATLTSNSNVTTSMVRVVIYNPHPLPQSVTTLMKMMKNKTTTNTSPPPPPLFPLSVLVQKCRLRNIIDFFSFSAISSLF